MVHNNNSYVHLGKNKVVKEKKALAKVQEFLSPAELPIDLETVIDEDVSYSAELASN
jgi:hypothetical protein